jgi:hypothetical protein
MRGTRTIAVVALTILSGCLVNRPFYYYDSNLNNLTLGMSKETLVSRFPAQRSRVTFSPILRAAKRQANGDLVEVLTLEMMAVSRVGITDYWFVFKNNKLEQWGKPEDWRTASASYDINFNPAIGIRQP